MIPSRYARINARGFSLVELMISIVIGIVLLSGMYTVFSGSTKSTEVNSALTEMQESARFALDAIARDARMAGFQGCIDINSDAANILSDNAPTDNFYLSAVSSSLVIGSDVWNPLPPVGFTPPTGAGSAVPGTHTLSVQFGNPVIHAINPMSTRASPVVLQQPTPDIVPGDIALISNCQVADIFTVTGVADATLSHAASDNGGDNRLSAPYGQAGSSNLSGLMRFEANVFFVGDTGRTNPDGEPIYALYKQALPYSNPPIEMVEGVENLKVRLGIRNAELGPGLRFIDPQDFVPGPGSIESIQIGLLMQSYASIASEDDDRTYTLAGNRIVPPGGGGSSGLQHAGDKRLRVAFNTSISIRNRR